MKRIVSGFFLSWSMIALFLVGCQPIQPITPEPVDTEALEAEFVAAVMEAEEAFQSEDAALAASYYTEDAVSLPPGFPSSVGREAIQADLQFYFDSFDIEREFTLTDYEVTGDTGIRLADWTQTLTPTDGSEPIVETGRCILGFEKIDGEWKIAWEIWNTFEE